MKDKEFIKKILQEQEVKLNNIDFTQNVMYRIHLHEERKKRFSQSIVVFLAMGLIFWMYLAIKPFFKSFIAFVREIEKIQSWGMFLSVNYIICYIVIICALAFVFYDDIFVLKKV